MPHDAREYFQPQIETLPRAQLQRLQENRLLKMLRFAYERAPLIRKTWDEHGLKPDAIQSLQDFQERAPFISKDAVRVFRDTQKDPYGGLNAASPFELKGVTFTSGTTGDPTPVPRGHRATIEAGIVRDLWMLGSRPGDYVVSLRPTFRIGHIGPYYQDAGFIPILFSHAPRELPRLIEALRQFKPTSLYFLSTPLLIALEDRFEKTGENPSEVFASLRGATFGGEPLSARRREMIRSWRLELHEMTGLGESISTVECSAHAGMHAWEDHVLVECLHPVDARPVKDGEVGELVVTALTDTLSPAIRYRTDDMITVDRSPCACGRTHARIRILGRVGDQTIVAGRVILPRELQSIIEAERATRAGLFQIVRPAAAMDSLRIRIGHDPEALSESAASLSARLRAALSAALQVPVQIELVADAALLKLGPPHKIPRVTKS
jgi:phenylacetate-CoA ligase